jgi:hypothetical protein
MELITIEQLFEKLDQPFIKANGHQNQQRQNIFRILQQMEETNNIKIIYKEKKGRKNLIDFDELYKAIPEMFEYGGTSYTNK